MKKIMSKITSILCVIVIMIGCLGVGASAKTETYTLGTKEYGKYSVDLQKNQSVTIY